jgi:hypothetical protein
MIFMENSSVSETDPAYQQGFGIGKVRKIKHQLVYVAHIHRPCSR